MASIDPTIYSDPLQVAKKKAPQKKVLESAAANENDILSNYNPSPRKSIDTEKEFITKLNDMS
jgi:hypothetical protein